MKKILPVILLLPLFLYTGCSEEGPLVAKDGRESGFYSALGDGSSGSSSGGSSGGDPQGGGGEAGLVTAAEWKDLDNWDFWGNLLNGEEFSGMPDYWDIHTNNRISAKFTSGGKPAVNVEVILSRLGSVLWATRTDNSGMAEFWVSPFQEESGVDPQGLDLLVDGRVVKSGLKFIAEGVNEVELASAAPAGDRVEISFIVDATGSMGDELEFLKADLQKVLDSVAGLNSSLDIYTSAVFYRDQGDEYLVRSSDFTADATGTIDYIGQQSANGGGDYPEAVHTALETGIAELQWSTSASNRMAFVLLDAPPHYEIPVISSIHGSISQAAEKGIRIIPIAASGINKETEFLLRYMAILTNGTYVFITDDSGVGNEHLEASVGEYEVELLKDLMVRLILEYSE